MINRYNSNYVNNDNDSTNGYANGKSHSDLWWYYNDSNDNNNHIITKTTATTMTKENIDDDKKEVAFT